MRILITGAAGFIASNLAEHFLREGNEVFGLDNFVTGSKNNVERLSLSSKFTFRQADVSDIDSGLKSELENSVFDEVYHLACPTGVPNLVPLAEEMLFASSYGTKNILDIALTHRSRFILTSSSEVYGDPEVFPQEESYTGNVSPTGVRSPYEEGKRFAESLVSAYCRKYNLSGKIVRVFNTYGPNMSREDLRVIPRFISQIENGKPLTIHGDGTQKRTFCHVNDLVEGLVLVAKKGEPGEVYNLGSQEEITIKELAELMIEVFKANTSVIFVDRPGHDHKRRLPDLSKIFSLGWKPTVSLKEGITHTLHSLESAKI